MQISKASVSFEMCRNKQLDCGCFFDCSLGSIADHRGSVFGARRATEDSCGSILFFPEGSSRRNPLGTRWRARKIITKFVFAIDVAIFLFNILEGYCIAREIRDNTRMVLALANALRLPQKIFNFRIFVFLISPAAILDRSALQCEAFWISMVTSCCKDKMRGSFWGGRTFEFSDVP